MNHKLKNNDRNISRKTRGAGIRTLCAICLLAMVLTTFVGCASYVPAEEFETLKNTLTEEIISLERSGEATKQALEAQTVEFEAAQKEIALLKGNAEAAKQEIDGLKNSNAAIKQEFDALKAENQTAKREIDDLKNSNAAAKQEIDALKAENQTAKQDIEGLKEQNESLQQQIDQLTEQLQELTENESKIRIFIDQGHNPTSYHNAGAVGNGLYEQDLTYAIGHLLAQRLKEDGRFHVRLSRPTGNTVLGTDNPTSLAARVRGAQDFDADYFISLHTNSFDSETANGVEVLVAEQGSVSYAFGECLLQGMIDSTNLKNRGMKLNPDLHVLKNATMPAALLEMGFITNATDAAVLAETPELFVEGIYNGLLAYFDLPANSSST